MEITKRSFQNFLTDQDFESRMLMITAKMFKKQICEIGKRIYEKGFVAANDGNISMRVSDNEFLITPTGVSKGFIRIMAP